MSQARRRQRAGVPGQRRPEPAPSSLWNRFYLSPRHSECSYEFWPVQLAAPAELPFPQIKVVNGHDDIVRKRQHPDPEQLVGWRSPLLVLIEQQAFSLPARLVARDGKAPQ